MTWNKEETDAYDDLLTKMGADSVAVLEEQACMVRMGVRLVALVGSIEANRGNLHSLYSILNQIASPPDVYPFVIDRGDRVADYGYAGAPWAVDVQEYISRGGDMPDHIMHCLQGLVLGYSKERIQEHYQKWGGKRFSGQVGEVSTSPPFSPRTCTTSGLGVS